MRFRLRTLILIVAVLSVVLAIVYYANNVNQTIRNSYAVWWVGDMVVEHMRANDGQWPQNWDDLRDDYQTCVKRSGQPWQFDELKRRVKIKWDANPNDLLVDQSDGVPNFRVIWLSDGTDSHWSHQEPNQIVLDYLNQNTD
jgi:hypothetical protein